MNMEERQRGVAEADRARAELYESLAQLRDRLDYAQRIDDSLARTKRRIAAEKRENPLIFGAAVAGAAAACGLVVWAVASKVMKAFE